MLKLYVSQYLALQYPQRLYTLLQFSTRELYSVAQYENDVPVMFFISSLYDTLLLSTRTRHACWVAGGPSD